jgi:hypothetical protein
MSKLKQTKILNDNNNNNNNNNNNLTKMEKIDIIDLFIELYPDIAKDRQIIINTVLGVIKRPNKYILERFDHKNKIYYLDKFGVIIDKYLNFCGCYIINENILDVNNIKIIFNNNNRKFKNEMEYVNKLSKMFYSN